MEEDVVVRAAEAGALDAPPVLQLMAQTFGPFFRVADVRYETATAEDDQGAEMDMDGSVSIAGRQMRIGGRLLDPVPAGTRSDVFDDDTVLQFVGQWGDDDAFTHLSRAITLKKRRNSPS